MNEDSKLRPQLIIAGVVGVGHETIKSRLRYAVAHLHRRLAAETDELTGTAS